MFTGTNPDGSPDLNSIKSLEVIGVIEDFHFESARRLIQPLPLTLDRSTNSIAFRFSTTDTREVLAAILIACLSLFALVSFTAERRTKEIGIRMSYQALRAARMSPARSLRSE